MARKDSIERQVLDVLMGAKAVVLSIERKNHIKIRWRYNGETRMSIVSQTASDHRAMKNAVSIVKRQMREIDRG